MSMRPRYAFLLVLTALSATAAHGQDIEYPPSTGCPEFHVRTPDMRGRTVASMREQYAGFQYSVRGRTYSDEYRRGQIVSQRPEPGACVMFNAALEVTVSQGPRCYRVPRVSRDALRRGVVTMGPEQRQVRLRRRPVTSDRPQGEILGQTPEAGACPRRLPEFIAVTVSRGPPPCFDVPRVSIADGERGFVVIGDRRRVPVEVTREPSERHARGEIIGQRPDPGVCVQGLDGIVLVVSAGPERPPIRPEGGGGESGDSGGLGDFVERYWPALVILVGLMLLLLSAAQASSKRTLPPDPARFDVRPRIDPGRQTATAPDRIETRGGDDA